MYCTTDPNCKYVINIYIVIYNNSNFEDILLHIIIIQKEPFDYTRIQ